MIRVILPPHLRTLAKVDSEVGKFEALVEGDIAQLDKALAKARVRHINVA